MQPKSVLAASLAGASPIALHQVPPEAIRRHRLDDVAVSRPLVPEKAGTRLAAVQNRPKQDFTTADKSLIRRVHGYMSHLQLLGILNERLVGDLGDKATLYTIEQLHAEIASVSSAMPATGNDWGTLRKLLSKARRAGVLDVINEQVINDFAVVYSLNQKQVLTLKDILLQSKEETE
jgi:hypothetical protein